MLGGCWVLSLYSRGCRGHYFCCSRRVYYVRINFSSLTFFVTFWIIIRERAMTDYIFFTSFTFRLDFISYTQPASLTSVNDD